MKSRLIAIALLLGATPALAAGGDFLYDSTLPNTPSIGSGTGGVPLPVTGPGGAGLPVSSGSSAVACDQTITVGATPQVMCGGTAPVNGWAVYNPNATDDLWCSDSVTALAAGLGSIRIAANGGGYETPPLYKPSHTVSCVGATTGDKVTFRRW